MVRGLAAHRYKPMPILTLRELVVGKKAMSKGERKARRTLEVTIMFEPSRLSAEYLADAYAQVVPLQKCSQSMGSNSSSPSLNESSTEGQWREQA